MVDTNSEHDERSNNLRATWRAGQAKEEDRSLPFRLLIRDESRPITFLMLGMASSSSAENTWTATAP